MKIPQIVSKVTVHENQIFSVERIGLLANDRPDVRPVLIRWKTHFKCDAVAAVVYNRSNNKIQFVKQFRPATAEKGGGEMLEIVAGKIDPGETPEQAIVREIKEEIGYLARENRLDKITSFFTAPGSSDERITVFSIVVDDDDKISAGGGVASEQESIHIVELGCKEVVDDLLNGKFEDAKTLVGLFYVMPRS